MDALMKPKTKMARLDDLTIRRAIWMVGAFVAIVALMGAWWVPPLLLWALWIQIKYDAASTIPSPAAAQAD